VSRLVLVATSAGIESEDERATRRAEDDALAARFAGLSPSGFADLWQSQELFSGTSAEASALWREDLCRSDPADLAEALSQLSTGRMPVLWSRLGDLGMPTTVIVGARDAKFMRLARRYMELLPSGELVVIPGAGHGLPREAPAALARALAG
jgi:pimeloyl-ACP methyl ester carboxylesterase